MVIKDKWLGIKYIKKKFSPNLYERANTQGHTVGVQDRANAAAEYLESKHWGKPNTQAPPNEPVNIRRVRPPSDNRFDLGDFSVAELKSLLKRLKKNKATGPDNIPTGFYQWLDGEALTFVVDILNQWWHTVTGALPEDKLKAVIVSIKRKGDPKKTRELSPDLTT